MSSRGLLVALASMTASVVGLMYGCLDEGVSPSPRDSGTAAVQDAQKPPAGRGGDAAPTPSIPPGKLRDGWEWWTDFVNCPIQIAASPAAMPPPLAWERCPENEFNRGLDCRQLVHPEGGRFFVAFPSPVVWRDPLRFSLTSKTSNGDAYISVIAEPDGSVRFAAESSGTCGVGAMTVNNDRVTLGMYSRTLGKEYGDAIATLGERPRMIQTCAKGELCASLSPSSLGVLRLRGDVQVLDWTTLTPQTLVSPQGTEATYQPGEFFDLGVDGRVLVTAGSRFHLRPYAYALGKVPIDLFGIDLPEGHGVVDVATDGHDWAWVERFYPDPRNYQSFAAAVYTAPFTLDPATLRATRKPLSFQPEQGDRTSYGGALGCGRWARGVSQRSTDPDNIVSGWSGLEIVRLSDGHRTYLPSGGDSWKWADVLGITCSEVFVVVKRKGDAGDPLFELTRIRLDSLPESRDE